MRFIINWLNKPVKIEHSGIKQTIKVNRKNYLEILQNANKYHTNWKIVTRSQNWFN